MKTLTPKLGAFTGFYDKNNQPLNYGDFVYLTNYSWQMGNRRVPFRTRILCQMSKGGYALWGYYDNKMFCRLTPLICTTIKNA